MKIIVFGTTKEDVDGMVRLIDEAVDASRPEGPIDVVGSEVPATTVDLPGDAARLSAARAGLESAMNTLDSHNIEGRVDERGLLEDLFRLAPDLRACLRDSERP